MSSFQLAVLNTIKDNNTYAAGVAKFLLSQYTDYTWVEEYYPIIPPSGERRASPKIQNEVVKDIIYYPNPAQSNLIVLLPENDNTYAMISILDISGRVLISKSLSQNKSNIPLNNLASGIYIIKIEQDNKIQLSKLIIKK